MKIYVFYYIGDIDNVVHNVTEFDKSKERLYAITDQKKFAKKFINQRNMKRFKIKKLNIDDGEWRDISEDRQEYLIDLYEYTGCEKGRKYNIKIASTMYEYMSVQDETDDWILAIMGKPVLSFYTFNKKIRKALNILKYENLYKCIGTYANYDSKFVEDYDMDAPSIDEVNTFLTMFAGTFE